MWDLGGGFPLPSRLGALNLVHSLAVRKAPLGPRNHVLEGGSDRTNPFAAVRGDKSAMRPFARLLCKAVPPVNVYYLHITRMLAINVSIPNLKIARLVQF